MKTTALLGALVIMSSTFACGQQDAPDDADGTRASSGGETASSGSSTGGTPNEPQGWVEILEPGQSIEEENSDADGWCAGSEGAFACDDGAVPGSGGTPPPGWGSSSGGTSNGGPNGSSSGGTTTSSSSGSGGNPANGGPVCDVEQFTTGGGLTPQMLLVVDKSGSMDETPSGQSRTKWNQVVSVLQTVTAQLEHAIDFGLSLFPAGGTGSCSAGSVRVNVGADQADEIAGALFSSGPGGGTPTASSLQDALAYMQTRDASRPRAVVLATDGAPNCASGYNPNNCVCTSPSCDDSRQCLDASGAVSAVQALANAGVSTFVIGIPGTDAFAQVLDQMAVAGGTALPAGGNARYYRTSNEQELKDAMDAIGTRLSECRFQLANAPSGQTPVEVSVDGTPMGRDSLHQSGWDLSGPSTVELFGAACQAMADGNSHTVTVRYCYELGG